VARVAARVVGSALRFDRFDWTIAVEEPAAQLFGPAAEIVRKVVIVNVGIVLLCSLVALQIARSVVRPIQALSQAAERVAAGEPDVTFPEEGRDEIGVLGRAFNEMIERLGHNRVELENNRLEIEGANEKLVNRNQELQRVNEVFHQLSITDELTKLHNHRFFQDHLPREMSRAARTGAPLCLVLIDIDDFKQLNDQHGHSVGDAVLKKTANVMNDVVREMDLLARYGGEEFALLASETSLDGAIAVAEKLRIEVSRARFPVVTLDGSSVLSITISVGVAAFNGDPKALFNDADRALYRAKAQGKDCVVAEEPSPLANG
jgi:diguanylate cyclase (GGDEF)-like protein